MYLVADYASHPEGHQIDSNNYRWELYVCGDCGKIAKCDKEYNTGTIFIDYDNTVTTYKPTKIES